MTSPQDIDRRFTQNRNEFDAIYQLLKLTDDKVGKIAEAQQHHGNRMTAFERTLKVHTDRLNHINTRLGHIESTQHDHTETLNAHTEILKTHTEILKTHTKRLDHHTKILNNHTRKLDHLDRRMDSQDSKLDKIIDMLGAR